ncbi:endonuclease/exonuclease/phosphatase family protein [Lapidilactobacillus bayanensis]|uniref:endonuclease/exonuclease/phosphatase family protein n=1 Tax=Lapidilactobacillus bayanensis TaxID=2485998 RepID=UPI000F7AF149|nr:endonuclease/exonuclease/phosphatase family protein [Lapidilactobacillus bayanensis]
MKRWLKWLLRILGVFLVVVAGYLVYVFATYYRLPAKMVLKPVANQTAQVKTGTNYTVQTYNIGYGAYTPKDSFFMDGGTESKARSTAAVKGNLAGVIKTTRANQPDFAFFQEVDRWGQRSRNVDEVNLLTNAFRKSHARVYGQNYDTPYLFYPFNDPIGAAKSGLVTLSNKKVVQAQRYSLPIATNVTKLTDLDRCFTVTQVPVVNGRKLQLINVHLSAFTKDQSIQKAQFKKLFAYAENAYQNGDYVIIGGDYNHRLLKNSAQIFNSQKSGLTWTHLFPFSELPQGFTVPTAGLAAAAVPSVRGMDQPYKKGRTFITLVDGFILSPNVSAQSVHIADTQFQYSDHNPAVLKFKLRQ